MKVKDYNKFRYFGYEDYYDGHTENTDKFHLGDVVILARGKRKEVGIILQCHGHNEYRTDWFGNCCETGIRFATIDEIKKYRPEIINELCTEN
jgi:hypothetical protein